MTYKGPRHVRVGIHYVTNKAGSLIGWFYYCHECWLHSEDFDDYGGVLVAARRHGRVCKRTSKSHANARNDHLFGVITTER